MMLPSMERKTLARPALMHVIRLAFVLVSMSLGASISAGYGHAWATGSLWGAFLAALFVALELGLRDLTFRRFSHATVGLLVGLTGAWLVSGIGFFRTKGLQEFQEARSTFELILYLGLGFLGMMLALRANREEFSLLIPYVRFRQDGIRDQPSVIGLDVLADGRLPKVCASGFLGGSFHVPREVIEDLREQAEQGIEPMAERGRRGLECLEQMRQAQRTELVVQEPIGPAEQAADMKLITLARSLGARIVTTDSNLQRTARLQGVTALNLEELAVALRPVLKPGDELHLTLIKEGKDAEQAVGFLGDGTMIVVNEARKHLGTVQNVVVVGFTKTSAGRLVFAELKDSPRAKALQLPGNGS
ncbi:MAG: hypothetical protein KGS60_14210 [Verrucomicrobia bacterium]|nr:hypothetical protein [Verrucomicrobiota bacterium]